MEAASSMRPESHMPSKSPWIFTLVVELRAGPKGPSGTVLLQAQALS